MAVGRVALTVRDGARVGDFYERVLGLEPLAREPGRLSLGAGETTLVELYEAPDARPRPPRATGLFHLALLVPDRAELAASLRRIVAQRWPLSGASDHLVSEALYLADPEGNGIEVYRDRPRAEWRRDGDEVAMATLPLDVDTLFAEGPERPAARTAPGARIGHVHLDVADLATTERFYAGVLGLDVTARGYPGALFLAAGGYHHHVGANTWRRSAGPPPAGAAGLRWFELTLPTDAARDAAADALAASGVAVQRDRGAVVARDPAGIALRLALA
ncbi:MAG: VOC family protein [Solirubrobacterales bacterium]|nr:VOC family protein [Solirubrobacterales bacterium]